MSWKTLLAYIMGTVDQELLLRNEYLATESRILHNQLKGRVHRSDGERKALAAIGQKLGKQALKEVATIVKPDTILAKRHGIPPAPERKKMTTWNEFIRSYMDVLVSTDFFTAEVWTKAGLATYYV